MVETEKHPEGSEQKQGWRGYVTPENVISELTLIILAITMVFVIKYACEAHKQSILLRDTLEVETRPYLGAGIGLPSTLPEVGQKIDVAIVVFDLGRRPVKAFVKSDLGLQFG